MKLKSTSLEVAKIKPNATNPRLIKDEKFKKLVDSVSRFPQMLEIRPIVLREDMTILGGNMRYKAAIEAGYKKLPVIIASDLTEAQEREFIIKDNVGYGDWDWEMIANEWEEQDLTAWGLDIPGFAVVDAEEEEEIMPPKKAEKLCPHCGLEL